MLLPRKVPSGLRRGEDMAGCPILRAPQRLADAEL